jgi:hypothetical protein
VGVPLAALIILFDLVVNNPLHPETTNNLAFLDIGSGHFSRIEYASQGALPGSLASDFVYLARHYVDETKLRESGKQAAWQAPLGTDQTTTGPNYATALQGNEWMSVS